VSLDCSSLSGSGGTQRLLLAADHQAHTIAGPVAKEVFDIVGHVVGGEEDLFELVLLQMLDLDLQNGLFHQPGEAVLG